MDFDTKIAVAIKEDLAVWQKLNVTAFTVSGIASIEGVIGNNYEDGSGNVYLPMIIQPIMIFSANRDQLRQVYNYALEHKFLFSIYIEELFLTPNDEENRDAVKAVKSEDLKLVGIAIRGYQKLVNKALKGLSLHS
ncbi:DUF2000 domain-containing protein [Nostoc commune]|uniref:DUF2000 domain-containing protein n=1 Tax=Nostoc commune TaxID=1178 RepID=UPI0018C7EC24|nr:DUF2000 domain-containing protein [Nostoc commune]MBG1262376.1 DUF2000 family protein [Nostoc commune BAE]